MSGFDHCSGYLQDAIYGEGNEGPKNEKKRKSASDADKTAADIDFKVLS